MQAKSVTRYNRIDRSHALVPGMCRSLSPTSWDGMPNAGTTSAITDNVTLWIQGCGVRHVHWKYIRSLPPSLCVSCVHILTTFSAVPSPWPRASSDPIRTRRPSRSMPPFPGTRGLAQEQRDNGQETRLLFVPRTSPFLH